MATRINTAALNHMLRGRGGLVDRHFTAHAERVQAVAKSLAPADSGRLKGSIRVRRRVAGEKVIWNIGSPLNYARYPECGTGVYAGRGPIRPRRAQYLVFWIDGRKIVTKSVKGQPGQHFMIEALRTGQPYPVIVYPCH